MSFPLTGNEKMLVTVNNFIAEKRIPHAILIEGDFGTGKHTLAKFIAKAIVCSDNEAPCCKCSNCHLAEIDSHPDIAIIKPLDGKKNIAIDQIRELRNEAIVKPHQALKRVFIIDCAENLNELSQNALLKILEEPPKTVMFIIIAESKSSLLNTIISRSTILSLNVPTFKKAFEHIKSTTNYSDTLIKDAINTTKNNIGRALNILNGKASSNTETAVNEYFKNLLDGDEFSLLKITKNFGKNRADADDFIKDLKYLIAQKIRQNPNSNLSKPLMTLYNLMPEFEDSLATNINLNLLFCNLSCKAMELIWRNK